MDWKVVGRSDRYYIKLFEQETNLRATIVLDNSNSMRFGHKMDYARHLTACLAYLLSMQQDLAGLCAVDEKIRIELPPASSPAHIDRLFRELGNLPAGTTTALPLQLHQLAERLPRRGMVIILSDLWLATDEFLRALQHLRYRKHQAMIIHLLDRTETTLQGPSLGREITLQDLETGEKLAIDPSEIRDVYQKQIEAHITAIRRGCIDCDSEYHCIFVDQPYDKTLVNLLARRR